MSPPLRLLMTADAVGGVWTYALDLAGGLAPDVRTTLAVLGPPPTPDQRRDANAAPGLTLVETGLPLDWSAAEPADLLAAAAAVRDLARRTDAQLLHLNSPALAAGGGFTAPVLGVCHSCLATWWSAVRDGPMPTDFAWRTQALWRGLLACDALAAPTRAFADATARAYDMPAPFVIPNGRRPQPARRQPRQKLVFTSGRLWDAGKNIGVLDEAAALTGVHVCAAGPLNGLNGERSTLRHATALGRLPAAEVADWLQRSAIFATSALYEPFGLGVLEAAQAGCALVLSDIATLRELWGGAAVFVDPRRPQAYAAAFDALLGDPARTARLGRLARTRADRFSVEAMSASVRAVYHRMLADFAEREAAA